MKSCQNCLLVPDRFGGGAGGGEGDPVGGLDLTAGAVMLGVANGTQVTAGNGSKGSWVQLSASTPADIYGFDVCATLFNGNGYLIDVGIGAAAAETVIVPNLPMTGRNQGAMFRWFIPMFIPAGTRVAVRAQSDAAVTSVVNIVGHTGDGPAVPMYDHVDAIGLSAVYGTQITMSGSADTKGSWIEFDAGADHTYGALTFTAMNNATFALSPNVGGHVDIGVGAVAAEVVRIGNLPLYADGNTDQWHPHVHGPIPCGISATTRIAVRAQNSVTETGTLSGGIHGFWNEGDQ